MIRGPVNFVLCVVVTPDTADVLVLILVALLRVPPIADCQEVRHAVFLAEVIAYLFLT